MYLLLCLSDKEAINSTPVLDAHYYHTRIFLCLTSIYDMWSVHDVVSLSNRLFTNRQTDNRPSLIMSHVYETQTDIKGLFIFWQTPNCWRCAGRPTIVSTACNCKVNSHSSLCLRSYHLGRGNSCLQIIWLDSIQQREESKLREEWVLSLVGPGGRERASAGHRLYGLLLSCKH